MQPLPPPMLLIPKEEAFEKLTKRIELGNQNKNININSMEELKHAKSEYYTWNEYNEEMLSRMFDNTSIKDGYKRSFGFLHYGDRPIAELTEELRDDLDYYLRKLESIRDRLELIAVSPKVVPMPPFPHQTLLLKTPPKRHKTPPPSNPHPRFSCSANCLSRRT